MMTGKADAITETGLMFFGKMSASISHELKNVLAIVHENAGLLDDFVLMAGRGMPIDPERVKKMASSILHQIRRGDEIINRMNRFAHSLDHPAVSVDLAEAVAFGAAFFERLAAMRSVTLKPQAHEGSVSIITHPFHLYNLMWRCIDFLLEHAGAEKTLAMAPERTDSGARLRLFIADGKWQAPPEPFPTDAEKGLLERLKASLELNRERGEVLLSFPRSIE